MRLTYQGASPACKYRSAWVSYKPEEETIVYQTCELMEQCGWQFDGFDGCMLVTVESKAEFELFREDWKRARATVKQHG